MPTCRSLERYPCIGYPGSNPQTWALILYQYVYVYGIGFKFMKLAIHNKTMILYEKHQQ